VEFAALQPSALAASGTWALARSLYAGALRRCCACALAATSMMPPPSPCLLLGLAWAVLAPQQAAITPSTVRVRPTIGSSGGTDAVTALNNFSLDAGGTDFDRHTSYALSDNSRFSRATWDCGAWGTQGAVITEKVLSLGGPQHLALARRWLLNTPVLGDSGEAFSTEGGQFHMGADGKWEANAELILSAALFAKHAGQHELFRAPVSRLVCSVLTNGTRQLLTRGGGNSSSLENSLCGDAVAGLEPAHPSLFATTLNAAYRTGTEGKLVNASGTALYQDLHAPESFSALSLPLRQYKPLHTPCWTVRVLVYKAMPSSQLIHVQDVSVGGAGWVDLVVSGEAGRYRVEIWPAPNATARENSIFTSAAWVSTTVSTAAGWSGLMGGSITFPPGTRAVPAPGAIPVPPTLGARLAAAMRWQLRHARREPASLVDDDDDDTGSGPAAVGIMTILDANWRGVGRDDVGASSAMWDLLRSGYQDSWLNSRFIASIAAMLAMQDSGLVDEAVVTNADLASAKAAFVRTFQRPQTDRDRRPDLGGYLSWVGCGRVVGDQSDCSNAEDGARHLQPVSIGLTPALAAAAQLDMTGDGPAAALELFDPVREAARNVSGRFRTNTMAIEAVNVTLWRASSRWKDRDAHGFARRASDSGGGASYP
jgi:hypothetical protein